MGHQGGAEMPKRGQWRGAEIFMEGGGNLQGGGRNSSRRGQKSDKKWFGGGHCIGLLRNNDWDTDNNRLVLL